MSLKNLTIAALFTIAPLASTAMAEEKPTLTIYTYDSFASDWGPGPQIKAGFEASCKCVVDFVGAEDAISALRKAQLEGDSTKADIILGLDTSVAAEAKSTDLFANHNTDLSAVKLPIDYTSEQFVPFDYGYFASSIASQISQRHQRHSSISTVMTRTSKSLFRTHVHQHRALVSYCGRKRLMAATLKKCGQISHHIFLPLPKVGRKLIACS